MKKLLNLRVFGVVVASSVILRVVAVSTKAAKSP